MTNANLINGQKPEFGNIDQIKFLQKKEREISDEIEYKNMRRNMDAIEKAIDDEASIGWVHFVIGNKTKALTEKLSGRSPFDIAIDKATGYGQGLIKGFLIDLTVGYKELIKLYRRTGNKAALVDFKALLNKTNVALNGEFKNIKEIQS